MQSGPVDLPAESAAASQGRGQVVDDDGAARLEQFLGSGRSPAAFEHQQVERAAR
jgi:hypothetical protein